MGISKAVQKATGTIATLGAAGTAVAGAFVFNTETGQLDQLKLGSLVIYDRRRREARLAARAARRAARKGTTP